jgi:hypothetical protein
MMRASGTILALAVVGFTSHALAFEEKVVPGTAAPAQGMAVGKTAKSGASGLELNVPSAGRPDTEIQIPGLGTIGVLPKLDFGLELLYGANSAANETVETPLEMNAPEAQPDALTLRGAIKNKF